MFKSFISLVTRRAEGTPVNLGVKRVKICTRSNQSSVFDIPKILSHKWVTIKLQYLFLLNANANCGSPGYPISCFHEDAAGMVVHAAQCPNHSPTFSSIRPANRHGKGFEHNTYELNKRKCIHFTWRFVFLHK